MNEVLDKLPITPLYENFNEFLAQAIQDKDDRAKVIDYVIKSQIIGNPLMEEFYMTQSSAVFQLICMKKSSDVIKTDMDEWVGALEPRMQEIAEVFFSSMMSFIKSASADLKSSTGNVTKGLELSYLGLVEQTDRLIAQSNEDMQSRSKELMHALTAHFESLEMNLMSVAESERRKAQMSFIEAMNKSMGPHIEEAFASTTDNFKMRKIVRDVAVCLGAFCIFSGLRWMFF